MQYSVISTRITSLYGSQPTSAVFACETAPFEPEILISMIPRPHLTLCAFKTAWLASELLVSVGPSPHLWCLDAKQRLLDQNNKSLWVPDITCRLCMQYIVISPRITSLYGSQPSSQVFACKTETFVQNVKSVWVPDLTCRFVHAKQRD